MQLRHPGSLPRLSHWGYHADFVVYPALVVASAGWPLWRGHAGAAERGWAALSASLLAGVLAWTAVEYTLHRWLLHHVPPFCDWHAQHHAEPAALIGTPTWLSGALFLALWAALARETRAPVAGGLVAGLMLGYLTYAFVHDAVHHRRARPGSWLFQAKLRHARHHRPGAQSDYGVSTALWDTVLRTRGADTLLAAGGHDAGRAAGQG